MTRGVIDADFIAYSEGVTPVYDIRKLLKYCKNKGIKTEELTDKDLENFIVGYDD